MKEPMQDTTIELLETLRQHYERLRSIQARLRKKDCPDPWAEALDEWRFTAQSLAWFAVQASWMELHDSHNAARMEDKIVRNGHHLTKDMPSPSADQSDEAYERGVMRRLEKTIGQSGN